MQQEVIETVMQELLEEQKMGNKKLDEITQKLMLAEKQIEHFKEHLSSVKLIVPPIDTSTMEAKLINHLTTVQSNLTVIKSFITAERKKQTWKEKAFSWFGWLLLTILSLAFLIWAIRSMHY